MFRKFKTHIRYNKNGVIIRPAGLDEEYEVGGWAFSCPWIKVGYQNRDYQQKYSDIIYVMTLKKEIIGYFMAHTEINMGADKNLPLYGNELILHDFAVDTRAYAAYSKILIDYLIAYAQYNGYCAVTVVKTDQCGKFSEFIERHYGAEEIDGKFYLFIENPRIKGGEKHLTVYENDKVGLEELYFLYDLKFDVSKTKCRLKLNERDTLSVDRKTGVVTFPESVKTVKDGLLLNRATKALVYLVVSQYRMDDIKPITLDYDHGTPDYYEAEVGELLYVSRSLKEIRNDAEYAKNLIERGYTKVVPNNLTYEVNGRSFSDGKVVYKLVK